MAGRNQAHERLRPARFYVQKQVFQQFKYLAQRVVRQDCVLTKGKSGTWLGVNGDKRAAEQETTTMHRVRG